jgi:hypothetical protein
MMIRISNEYLDFDEEIEVEKQIKLVEEISTTDGDVSYSFEIDKTLKNTRLLGNPMPDNVNKPVYQKIEASLLNSDGAEIHNGYIRVERITAKYVCSFFAGNNNWFSRITGLVSELPLSEYDIELNVDNIQASWDNTSGITYTLVDNGTLFTRSSAHLKKEDFVPGIYIKTLFEKIFNSAGIKIHGELLNDWMFQNTICQKSPKNSVEIDRRSSYVQKTTELIVPEDSGNFVDTKITFDNDNAYPFYDGDADLFDLANSRYVADVPMDVEVIASVVHTMEGSASGIGYIGIYINGVSWNPDIAHNFVSNTPVTTSSPAVRVPLNTGDVLEIYSTVFFPGASLGGDYHIHSGNVKITPVFLYKHFGASTVPNWTQQQFVSNVLRIFNVLPSYNAANGTLTLNLFDKIKERPSVDLSEYISDTEIDYEEFIANYGQKSKMSYNEVEFDDLKEYNSDKYFKYGQGYLEIGNDFIEPEADIIESDFSNPIAYEGVFDMSMERLNLIELEEGDGMEFTSVSEGTGGLARFAIADHTFLVGNLVRIDEEVDRQYNGDWVVKAIDTGWIELENLPYNDDIFGEVVKLEYVYTDNDDVFLLVNVPDYQVSKFSGHSSFLLETATVTDIAMGYFDIINTGRQVNEDFLFSLSFGGIVSNRQYQIPLTERYFRVLERILNDPVKLFSIAHLPNYVYRQIDFLSPITVRTLETTNQYYVNRISGYKESYLPCTLELIKLP